MSCVLKTAFREKRCENGISLHLATGLLILACYQLLTRVAEGCNSCIGGECVGLHELQLEGISLSVLLYYI